MHSGVHTGVFILSGCAQTVLREDPCMCVCAHVHAEPDHSQLDHTFENTNIMLIKMLKVKDGMIMFWQVCF